MTTKHSKRAMIAKKLLCFDKENLYIYAHFLQKLIMIGKRYLQQRQQNFRLSRISNNIPFFKISATLLQALIPPFIQGSMIQNHMKCLFSKEKQILSEALDLSQKSSERGQKIPLGVSQFKIASNYAGYIDKTLFILNIISSADTDYYTMFNGVGKTLALSTFSSFVSMEVDQNGKRKYPSTIGLSSDINQLQILKANKQKPLKDEEKICFLEKIVSEKKKGLQKKLELKNYFKGKQIMNTTRSSYFTEQFMGEYPVIQFVGPSFEGDLTIEKALDSIKMAISFSYRQHSTLLPLLKAKYGENSYKYQMFSRFIQDFSQIKDIQIKSSLIDLRNTLFEFYHQPVYILIDQFDRGFATVLANLSDSSYIICILSSFYGRFIKDYPENNKKVLIMGNIFLQIPSLLSRLNNINHIPFTNIQKIGNFPFGYNLLEVQQLMNLAFSNFNSENDDQKNQRHYNEHLDNIKQWANGYFILNQQFFNPLTVNNYMQNLLQKQQKNKQLFLNSLFQDQSGWVYNGTTPLLIKMISKISKQSQQLDNFCKQNFSLCSQSERYANPIEPILKYGQKINLKAFYSFLFRSGYLTQDPDRKNRFIPPNLQIKRHFYQRIYCQIISRRHQKISKDIFWDIIDSARVVCLNLDGETEALRRSLQSYYKIQLFANSGGNTNSTDLINERQLKLLQTEFEGYLAISRIFGNSIVTNYWINQQYVTEQRKKIDIFCWPKVKPTPEEIKKDKKNKAIIFKFKIAREQRDVQKQVEKAITQIIEKYLPLVREQVNDTPYIQKIRFGSIVVFKSNSGNIDVQVDIFTFTKQSIYQLISIIKNCKKKDLINILKSKEIVQNSQSQQKIDQKESKAKKQ